MRPVLFSLVFILDFNNVWLLQLNASKTLKAF